MYIPKVALCPCATACRDEGRVFQKITFLTNSLVYLSSTLFRTYRDYGFDRLRKEAEGVYESYADMGLNEWITMRIEVKGKQARLFLNDNKQPSLIVNDLKLGDNVSGAIGLWVDGGTEGYFKDLKITKH